jgi:hypothetical protein
VNEDAWLLLEAPDAEASISFAVIDGAGVRKSLSQLETKIRAKFPCLTPAAFASHLVKRSLEGFLRENPAAPLASALAWANDALRAEITRLIGFFDPAQMIAQLDQPFSGDLRNVRLLLPTCVVTLARINLVRARLEFAHLGDTSLYEAFHAGGVLRHTRDQMDSFDAEALQGIRAMQLERGIDHFREAVSSPEGREFITRSGIYLNYVDADGKTEKGQGCGVINGLPEMEDYIETGNSPIDISKTVGFFALSDGLELLAPWQESAQQKQARYEKTSRLIRDTGLRGLYHEMAQMAAADAELDRYPRTKLQDDATGIFIELGYPKG